MSEDQFTSVQWDRESKIIPHETHQDSNGSIKNEPIDDSKVNGVKTDNSELNTDQNIPELNDASIDPVKQVDHNPVTTDSDDVEGDFEKFTIDTVISDAMRDVDQFSKPFMSYLITTKTDNPSIIRLCNTDTVEGVVTTEAIEGTSNKTTKEEDEKEKEEDANHHLKTIKVRRRYGDFRNLYHCLMNDFPTVLIPSLPSKSNLKYLTGDTFSQDFVNKRLNSLNRFIKFLNSHKELSQSSVYHLFLSDSNDWITFSKNLKVNINEIENNINNGTNNNSSGGVFSNSLGKVVNEELITETVMNFLTPSKHKRETNKEILEINDKLNKLYENLIKLDKIFQKLNKKNNDLSVDYELFSNQINKLSDLNQDYELINQNFQFFAKCFKNYSINWSKSFKFIDESFLVTLKDCSKYIINLTNLIELQHNKKIDLQVLQDYLDKAKAEYNSLPSNNNNNGMTAHKPPPSPIKSSGNGIVNNTTQLIKDTLSTSATNNIGSSTSDSKKQKLESKIKQLEEEIEIQNKVVNDLINKIVNEEYPNWDQFNKNEIKLGMVELCDNQIDFYKSLVDDWNETENKLIKRIEQLNS